MSSPFAQAGYPLSLTPGHLSQSPLLLCRLLSLGTLLLLLPNQQTLGLPWQRTLVLIPGTLRQLVAVPGTQGWRVRPQLGWVGRMGVRGLSIVHLMAGQRYP